MVKNPIVIVMFLIIIIIIIIFLGVTTFQKNWYISAQKLLCVYILHDTGSRLETFGTFSLVYMGSMPIFAFLGLFDIDENILNRF